MLNPFSFVVEILSPYILYWFNYMRFLDYIILVYHHDPWMSMADWETKTDCQQVALCNCHLPCSSANSSWGLGWAPCTFCCAARSLPGKSSRLFTHEMSVLWVLRGVFSIQTKENKWKMRLVPPQNVPMQQLRHEGSPLDDCQPIFLFGCAGCG